MSRTQCTVNATNIEKPSASAAKDPEQPALTIPVTLPSDELAEHLPTDGSDDLPGEEIDVTYRYQTDEDLTPGHGVLGITNTVTGDFILEGNTGPALIEQLVNASKNYAHTTGNCPYQIEIECEDNVTYTVEPEFLLVFDKNGTLLRERSLIPNNIHV